MRSNHVWTKAMLMATVLFLLLLLPLFVIEAVAIQEKWPTWPIEVTISEEPVTGKPLTVTYEYGHGELENEKLTQLRWYRDGILQSQFNNKQFILETPIAWN